MLILPYEGAEQTLAIDHYLWTCVERPVAQATLALDALGLHCRFEVKERNPLTTALVQQEPMLMVCQDSAVELFLAFADSADNADFAPALEHCLYLNIELNSAGICYAKHGHSRKGRTAFTPDEIASLQIKAERGDDAWSVSFLVPRALIAGLTGYDALAPGNTFALNLYKISETKEHEHYVAYNPVAVPTPNFHLPEFFALTRVS